MKTLLMLVDGMRPDSLANCAAAQRILSRSVYTLNAQTVMPSVTLPCHMSLFYSVEPGRHGTTTNVYMPQVRPINGLCETLASQRKTCAFFYSWGELRDLCRPSSLVYSQFIKGGCYGYDTANDKLTDSAIAYLTENDIDFTFLYYGFPDAAGHSSGWMSEAYMRSMDNSWENIERIIKALPEDYSVIITADHGGHDRTHGTAMPEDMTIPLIFAGAEREFIGDLTGATILDLAPTVAAITNVSVDSEWEGKCLLK